MTNQQRAESTSDDFSPSFLRALSQHDSGDLFYNASSGAFSGSLHRVSSSGTDTSAGSGTEWFEAVDYDSDAFGTASSSGLSLEANGGAQEEEEKGMKLALLLLEGISKDHGVLQGPQPGSDSSRESLRAEVSLQVHENDGMSLTGMGVHLRLFTQVLFFMSFGKKPYVCKMHLAEM